MSKQTSKHKRKRSRQRESLGSILGCSARGKQPEKKGAREEGQPQLESKGKPSREAERKGKERKQVSKRTSKQERES